MAAASSNDAITRRFDRIDDELGKLRDRVGVNEKAIAAMPYIGEAVKRIDENCSATREWVEEQLAEKERQDKEERRLSKAARLTIVGLCISAVSVLIAAVVVLHQSGAF